MPDFIAMPIDIGNLPANVVFNDFGYAELEEAFFQTFLNDNFNRSASRTDFNDRCVIPSAQIDVSGESIRVHFRAPVAAQLDMIDVWVGHKGASGADFDGTQVKLQFSGVDNFSISNGEVIISDEIVYPVDSSKDFVISFGTPGSNANTPINDLNATGITFYFRAGAGRSGDTIASGYQSIANRLEVAFKIEVFKFSTSSPTPQTLPVDSAKTFDLVDVFIYSGNFTVDTDIIVEQYRSGGVIRTFSLDTTPNAYGGFSLDALLTGTALPSGTTIDIDANDLFRFQLESDGTEARGVTGIFIAGSFSIACDYPAETDVRLGIDYNGAILTGSAAIPGANDVRDGVAVDATTGTYEPADEADVLLDVEYGAGGNEFKGTLLRYAVATDPNDSIRERIIDVLDTRLQTITVANNYRTNIGDNVSPWRDHELTEAELPALKYKDLGSIPDQESFGVVEHQLVIQIIVTARDETSPDVMRQMIADVTKAIGTDEYFSQLAEGVILPVDDAEVEQTAAKHMEAEITLIILYSTDRLDPYT